MQIGLLFPAWFRFCYLSWRKQESFASPSTMHVSKSGAPPAGRSRTHQWVRCFLKGPFRVVWGNLGLKQESPIQAFKRVVVEFFHNAAPLSMRNSVLANFAAIFAAARQIEKMYLFRCPFSISSPYTQDLLAVSASKLGLLHLLPYSSQQKI